MKAISVVVPVFHNAETLDALHERLRTVLARIDGQGEIIYVDDGSGDDSYARLREIARSDPAVRLIRLSRNFGSTGAILAGLARARGACAAVIAADLQDPPEIIAEFYARQRDGYDVVLGARAGRDDPLSTRLFAALFYGLFRRFAMSSMPPQGFDCFLATRRVYLLLVETAKANTYLMGQILWLGFPRTVVRYHRQKRPAGRSMWSFWRKVRYFIDSFVSFSYAPIRASSLLGLGLAVVGFFYALLVVASRLLFGAPVEGWASLMIVVLILGGAQLMVLGILGEYLWRTFDASRSRPPYIVESLEAGEDPDSHLDIVDVQTLVKGQTP